MLRNLLWAFNIKMYMKFENHEMSLCQRSTADCSKYNQVSNALVTSQIVMSKN